MVPQSGDGRGIGWDAHHTRNEAAIQSARNERQMRHGNHLFSLCSPSQSFSLPSSFSHTDSSKHSAPHETHKDGQTDGEEMRGDPDHGKQSAWRRCVSWCLRRGRNMKCLFVCACGCASLHPIRQRTLFTCTSSSSPHPHHQPPLMHQQPGPCFVLDVGSLFPLSCSHCVCALLQLFC